MSQQAKLPEHIQLIHSISKQANEHQVIVGVFSLITGLICLALGSWMSFSTRELQESPLFSSASWLSCWMSVFILIVSFFLLIRIVHYKRVTLAITTDFLHILRSAAPAPISLGIIGCVLALNSPGLLALSSALWITSYGLALLSAKFFVSRAIRLLGLAELILGVSLSILAIRHGSQVSDFHLANFFQCLGFGVLPLIFASGVLLLKKLS